MLNLHCLVPLLFGALVGAARAEDMDIYDARIRGELEAAHPEAVQAWDAANAARDEGDLVAAEAGYRAVETQAPAFYHATRRRCGVLTAAGRRAEGIAACREALAKGPEDVQNQAALATALMSGEPRESEVSEASRLVSRVQQEDPENTVAAQVAAQVAIQRNDLDGLRRAQAILARIAPEDVNTQMVTWVLALSEGRIADARAALERARELGLPPEDWETFSQATDEATPVTTRYGKAALAAFSVWGLGWLLLFGAGQALSQLTLHAASQPPARATGEAEGSSVLLRKAYGAVLWASSAFYYVSLPLVAVSVLALGGGLIYAFFALGRIPVQLVLVIALLTLGTIVAMVKSLFATAKDEDPGLDLDLGKHPRLRALLDEVAAHVGTRPVDKVYLTPGTDMAVFERGGLGRTLRGGAERCLVLGVGVLEGFQLRALRAVLAHEYGHFSNRDTAGGGLALAVRRSLLTMALGIAEAGGARMYNPAWWFVQGFHALFLRISQGASRLQEVLADRWAAFTYGAHAFEAGLRHVIARSLRFDVHVSATLNEVLERKQPLANLYAYQPASKPEPAAAELEAALNRPPSPYDSHPSPATRFALVRALDAPGRAAAPDDELDAWSLFTDREAIEAWMTREVRGRIALQHGVVIPGPPA